MVILTADFRLFRDISERVRRICTGRQSLPDPVKPDDFPPFLERAFSPEFLCIWLQLWVRHHALLRDFRTALLGEVFAIVDSQK